MKFLSLLTLLPLTQLIQLRRHFLFVLFYSITFTPMQFLPVSTSPIQIDQNEILIPQEIKELINRSFDPNVQRYITQISNINENDGHWETVVDPKLYVITELDTDRDTRVGSSSGRQTVGNIQQIQQLNRERRAHHHHRSGANSPGHSLSIVNPLDVLRQRLLLEISRRRMRQSNMQIIANAEILKNIG